jgi:hypothetical protein
MTTFINYLVAAHRTLETSKTFAWINAASKRVAMATPPRERRHLMSLCACASPTEFAIRSLSDGFIDLVFGNWYEDSEPWPPVVHSRRQGGYLGPPCFPTKVVIPEVFKMDWTRIKSFNAELVDIAIAHAILVTFRKRFAELDPTLSVEQISVQVASLLDCYKHVMSVGAGLSPDVYRDLAHQMASRVQGVTHDLAWEFACTISRDITHPEGEAFHASFASLRKLVHLMLTNTLLIHRVQPESFLYDMRGLDAKHCVRGEPIPTAARLRVQSRRFVTLTEPLTGQGPATSDPRERQHRPLATPAVASAREVFHRTVAEYRSAESAQAAESGFEPLVNDIRVVLDRMVKTADFNLCVFANLYARKGMLVGTGKLLPLPELPQN